MHCPLYGEQLITTERSCALKYKYASKLRHFTVTMSNKSITLSEIHVVHQSFDKQPYRPFDNLMYGRNHLKREMKMTCRYPCFLCNVSTIS